ncbi:MAG: S-methyl-5-thioribose-1-phosphate isomerase [Bifidobacteriaceae bacterium]|nr:S-methyl-5-thioribose-1-phosphate isomerase [Bifidobacteriaceae bacterium]
MGVQPHQARPRTIDWVDGAIQLIDQTMLPRQLVLRRIETVNQLITDIQRLAVRGAPALGIAGALGVALAATRGAAGEELASQARLIAAARPTAVNLAWGVARAMACAADGPGGIVQGALALRDQDIAACQSMSVRGADLLADLLAEILEQRPLRLMTICNTGSLAAVERGTALGVIQEIFDRGQLERALPLETRPLLQGARLTAWELERLNIPYSLTTDGAAPFLLQRGQADAVLVGADRIAANGDTANKVGTFALSLGAQVAGVPFLVVAPESTVDLACPRGTDIPIEDRGPAEVRGFGEMRWAPATAPAYNPAFDVTPAVNITAIVTDRRIIRLGEGQNPGNVPLGQTRQIERTDNG